jgi:hypothetical protein
LPLPPPPPPPPPPSPPPPPAPPASSFETTEYNRTGGLDFLKASSAYTRGATGEGITIAIIDTTFDATHPDLIGQIVEIIDINAASRAADDIDTEGHGTLVTGVAVARKDDAGVHGIAFESDVLAIRADRPGSCQEEGDDGGCKFRDSDTARAIDRAIAEGARIINLSLGGPPDNDPTLENAVRRAAAAGVLVVISAGNEAAPAGPNPDDPSTVDEAEGISPTEPANVAGTTGTFGRVVAVGSVGLNGEISDFSNRAGETSQAYYILAPGEGIVTTGPDDDVTFPDDPDNDPDNEGDFYRVSGTSFAAPYMAGALSLMLDVFPNMTPEDALSALLDSARDYVDPDPDLIREEAAGVGIDPVSGVGILDLDAAFAPQGATSVSINGDAIPTSQIIAPARGAFGDWASRPGGLSALVFTDRFNRAYRFDAASIMPRGEPRLADFDQRADAFSGQSRAFRQGPVTFSWFQPAFRDDPGLPFDEPAPAQFTAEYRFSGGAVEFGRGYGARSLAPQTRLINEPGARTGFSNGGWARYSHDIGDMAMEVFSSDDRALSVSGVGLSRIEHRWGLRGQVSMIRDDRTALGGFIQSRFGGEDRSRLSAYALEGALRVADGLRLSAGLEAASVDLPGVDANGIWTSRWSLGADTLTPAGAFGLTVAQPRRAEAGTLDFNAITGLDASLAFISRDISASLTPSGREINYEASWSFGLPANLSASLVAALSTEPNHVSNSGSASVYWFTLSKTW